MVKNWYKAGVEDGLNQGWREAREYYENLQKEKEGKTSQQLYEGYTEQLKEDVPDNVYYPLKTIKDLILAFHTEDKDMDGHISWRELDEIFPFHPETDDGVVGEAGRKVAINDDGKFTLTEFLLLWIQVERRRNYPKGRKIE